MESTDSNVIRLQNVAQTVDNDYWKDPKHWPKSLHDFISRSFKQASKLRMTPAETKLFKAQLKSLINMAVKKEKIMENDWDKQTLPLLSGADSKKLTLFCDTQESGRKSIVKSQKPVKKRCNIFGELETDSEEDESESKKPVKASNEKEDKSQNGDKKGMTMSDSLKKLKKQKKPVEKKQQEKKATEKELLEKKPFGNKYEIRGKKAEKKGSADVLSDENRRAERSKRFERELSTPMNYNAKEEVISTKPIVGQNTVLEKKYLRLTSQPKPENVRSLKTLRKTLQLLFDKYFEGATYNYLCDQCKSLRQDLTVQNIQNDFTMSAYEFHSKIAIQYKDWGEFNQCQSQLKIFYDIPELPKPHLYEFLSYRMLYYVLTNNFIDALDLEFSFINNNIDYKNDEFLRYAYDIFRHVQSSRYDLLADVVRELFLRTEKEEAEFLETIKTKKGQWKISDPDALSLKHSKFYYFTLFVRAILERENIKTLSIISSAYRQIPVSYLQKMLGFGGDENSEQVPEAFFQFLTEKGLQSFLDETKTTFDCYQARGKVNEMKNQIFKRIDIKGQL